VRFSPGERRCIGSDTLRCTVKRLEEYASGDFSLEELLVRVSDQFLRELGEKAAGPIVAQTEWHPSIDVLQLG
jgi:hypothetical protein